MRRRWLLVLDGHREQGIEPPDIFEGDIYAARHLPRVPYTLGAGGRWFGEQRLRAAAAFGVDVVEHYAHFFRTEIESFPRRCD